MKFKIPWRSTLVLVAVGAAVGFGYNALRVDGLPWIAQAKATVNLEDLTPPQADPPGSDSLPPAQSPEPAMSMGEASLPSADPPADEPTETSAGTARTGAARQGADQQAVAQPIPDKAVVAPAAAKESPQPKDLYADIPEADLPIMITLAQARGFYDRKGILILDARDGEEYAEGHIRGALSAPYDDVVADTDWMEKTARDPRPVLVYCSGGDCEVSHDLADEISRSGHRRVLILGDGITGWTEAGYPTSTGMNP